jgi:hydroxypyruvate reductase
VAPARPEDARPEDARAADARAGFDAALRAAGADALLDGFAWNDAAARPLQRYRSMRLVAMGKAALAMTGVAARQIDDRGLPAEEGLAVVPDGYRQTVPARFPAPSAAVNVIEGGHPAPTEASVRAGERALALADEAARGDLLVVLLSGGGTALCNAFVEGLSLTDARRTFALLLESGADIHAVNAVRKHLSRVGGGQLAEAAAPADLLALAVSDVPGDDLSAIASGPTVPDPTTFADAGAVLRERGLWGRVPQAVRRHIEQGEGGGVPETPGPGAACFRSARTCLVGGNEDALRAARAEAEQRGYDAHVLRGDPLEGEAREAGRRLAREALRRAERAAGSGDPPRALLAGGETTVTVRGEGTGGRSQELALAAALELEPCSEAPVALLAAGTDGIDGPTDAAGAVVTPQTAPAMRRAGLDPEARLADNDAHPALDAAGALLRPGPTHTNVMDVAAVLVG